MPETQTLPAMVRAKYPGVYDDLSDADLDAKVRAKYPGVYDDIPKPSAAKSTGLGVEKATGVGPEPTFLERAGAAIGPTIRGAGDVTGANWLLERTGLVDQGRLTGPEVNARDEATRHAAGVGGLAATGLQIGDAIIGAAKSGGAVRAAYTALHAATPIVKYEATRHILSHYGVPGSDIIAFLVAGGTGRSEPGAAPTAEAPASPGAPEPPVVPRATAQPGESPLELTRRLKAENLARQAAQPLTPEQLAAQAASGHTPVTPQTVEGPFGGTTVPPEQAKPVSGPQGVPRRAPEPAPLTEAQRGRGQMRPAAAAPTGSAATTPDLTTASTETIHGLLDRWASRAGMELSGPERDTAVQLVRQGAKPSEVIDAIVHYRSGGVPPRVDVDEAAAKLAERWGLPTDLPPTPGQHARGVTGKWKQRP